MIRLILTLSLVLMHSLALAQAPMPAPVSPDTKNGGTVIVVPAFGEVKMANDEARLTFFVEEQDKDKAAAASRVNRKMKEGIDLLKRLDPQATLATRGYHTYPVYSEQQERASKAPQPIAWRVGQSLEMTTTNLSSLPQTVASAQNMLALQSLHFGLSDAARRQLDRQVMAAAYHHLRGRVEVIATIMGRKPSEALVEQVDFSGGGDYVRPWAGDRMEMASKAGGGPEVETPRFEPGETPVQMQIVGRVRFP